MLQRLPITLAQVKAVNIYENLLSGSIDYLYRAKKVTKKYATIL